MKVTNLTSKKITLVDGQQINPYSTKKLYNVCDEVKEQLKNLEKLGIVEID